MLTTADGKPTNAILGFMQMLLGSIEKFNPDAIVCSLESESPTFRSKMDSNYKANRKEADPELKEQIGEIINIIGRLEIKTLYADSYEADDVIGSFAMQSQEHFDEVEIVSGDRDLLQLIRPKVKVYLPGKTFSDLIGYTREMFEEKYGINLDDFVLYKALIGDTSDNIKGIPGVGPKTAQNIVNRFHSVDSIIANCDEFPPKVCEAITENADQLKKYYDLSRIETDLKIDLAPEDTKVSKINASALRKIVDEYELKSLTKKVAKFIDTFEQKYGGFGLFDLDEDLKRQEIEYTINDEVNFIEDLAFVMTSRTGYLIGNGSEFKEVEAKDLYNFVILKQLKRYVGFELKPFIKDLVRSGIENIENLEFIDLKLAWHLIKSNLSFETLNEIASNLKINQLPTLLAKTLSEISESEMEELFAMEKKLETVIAIMEMEGIPLDVEYLKNLEGEFRDKIAEVKQEIFKVVGHEFNPASTKELGHELFEVLKLPVFKKNKTGYSTDDNTLTKLEGMSDIIPLIKAFRFYSKILSTYVIGLQPFVGEDGKVHSNFRQEQTPTGRLSSINPNVQNLPADAEMGEKIKKAFKSEPGYFLSFDYSQIELRVLAFESKDKGLIKAFAEDEDIHTTTAKLVFEKDEITKDERRFAKTINFGIVYGMEPYGLSQALKIDQKAAKEFIDKYFEKFPDVKKYFDKVTKQLDEKGYVNTFLGRRRYFPAWKSTTGFQKRMLFREAINMPIQGGAAEVIKLAMINIFEIIQKEKLKVKLISQVHDELVFLVENKNDIDDYAKRFQKIMEESYDIEVPLKAEAKFGTDLSFIE